MPGSAIEVTARASLKKRWTISWLRRQLGQQHLDRGAAAEQRVLGEVDRAHAALAELAQPGTYPMVSVSNSSKITRVLDRLDSPQRAYTAVAVGSCHRTRIRLIA